MADKEYYVGSSGPFLYDDADTDVYEDAEPVRAFRGPKIFLDEAPVENPEGIRFQDLAEIIEALPAETVVSETSFGISPVVGTSEHFAREDHSHGTPGDPIVQSDTSIVGAAFTANAGAAVNNASTFDGYTLQQVVAALKAARILA